MILRIDHVGLVTDDPAAAGRAMAVLGMLMVDGGVAPDYGVACEFWQHRDGAGQPGQFGQPGHGQLGQPAVELVSPARNDSAVTDYLSRKGPGLYHIAFEVDDLESDMVRLKENGFVPVDREPCTGARAGMRVAFLYVRKPVGLLIELVQYSATTDSHPAGDRMSR